MSLANNMISMAEAGAATFGIRAGTEQPRFDVVTQLGEVEIRRYHKRLCASITVAGDEITARSTGFRRLARFIFGDNAADTSISMTAPVVQSAANIAMTAPVAQQQSADGRWMITFFMPAKFTLATLPKPRDPDILIHEAAPVNEAAYRFSGSATAARVATARAILLATLAGSGWQAAGDPAAWFYDPPWTMPFLRRNEVVVRVEPALKTAA